MICFLSHEGVSTFTELTDYEIGPSLSEIVILDIEIGRLVLTNEKRRLQTNLMTIASVMNSDLVKEFDATAQQILDATDILGRSDKKKPDLSGLEGITHDPVSTRVPTPQSQSKVDHSIKELSKLNALLSRG